jgi:hypothetical protein
MDEAVAKVLKFKKQPSLICHCVLCETFVSPVVNFFTTLSTKISQRAQSFELDKTLFGFDHYFLTFETASTDENNN